MVVGGGVAVAVCFGSCCRHSRSAFYGAAAASARSAAAASAAAAAVTCWCSVVLVSGLVAGLLATAQQEKYLVL